MGKLLDLQGNPIVSQDEVTKINELKSEIAQLMDSKLFKQYATAIVLGNQLYAWACSYIINELPGDKSMKVEVINRLNATMITPDGKPKPFDERRIQVNMEALRTFIKNKVNEHVQLAKQKRNTLNNIVRDLNIGKASK